MNRGWVELVKSFVEAAGPSTAEEIALGTGLPLGFVRNGLAELAPAPPETKKPPPRAGTLVIIQKDRFELAPNPPAPPASEPEPVPCPMTSMTDGKHVPSSSPNKGGSCEACGRVLSATDPVRVLDPRARDPQ